VTRSNPARPKPRGCCADVAPPPATPDIRTTHGKRGRPPIDRVRPRSVTAGREACKSAIRPPESTGKPGDRPRTIATHASALDHAFLAGAAQRASMSLQADLAKLVPRRLSPAAVPLTTTSADRPCWFPSAPIGVVGAGRSNTGSDTNAVFGRHSCSTHTAGGYFSGGSSTQAAARHPIRTLR
jgi:hypothetical protein